MSAVYKGRGLKPRLCRFIMLPLLIFTLALCSAVPAGAEEYVRNTWTDNQITPEQSEAVLKILREHAKAVPEGEAAPMYDTGLEFASVEEAVRFCFSMKEFFLGKDDFGLCYNETGYPNMTAEIYTSDRSGTGIKFHATGQPSDRHTVYAGWLPGANPAECLRQHDVAGMVVMNVAANAPEEEEAMYRYFFDWLREHVTYDDSLSSGSHSAYSALVEGSSVCEGYARAFSAFCRRRGKPCRNVVVNEGPGPYVHERNLVWLNGEPRWVDATWGDATDGDPGEYFLFPVNAGWRMRLGL